MTNRLWKLSLGLVVACALLAQGASAQQGTTTSDLKQDIETLKASLVSIQQDLQAIKGMLQSGQPAAAPQNVLLDLGTHPSVGQKTAKLTVVEFSDFECPYCSRARETVDQMMQDYAGKVRLVFRQFPLVEMHKNAEKAAEASLCANEQGKFWEYHDVLFKNQQKLEVAQLKQHAGEVGLDAAQFTSCLDSGKHKKDVDQDMAAGQKLGVPGTPTVFVNGIMLSSASKDEFKRVIDQELASR